MAINILSAIGMWFVGVLLYSFGVMQILIVLRCAIPLTKKFSKVYIVDTAGIYKKCAITILFWAIVAICAVCAVMVYGNDYVKYGFWIGFIFSLVISFGKWGINQQNILDYFRAYQKHYPKKALDEIFNIK